MYTLYIGNKNYSSWSLRPWLLLTELQIPFTEELVPFDDDSSYEKFRTFSPSGLVPCLIDRDETIWESLAIVEYLAERHSTIWPYSQQARAWARSATAEMHAGFSNIRNDCPMTVGLRIRLHSQSEGLVHDIARLAELWRQGLTRFGGPYLAGSRFTAVDAFFAPVVFRIQTYGLEVPADCRSYVDLMLKLPGMSSWSDAALAESFREPSHEDEIHALGAWLQDYRA
ncbi:MAG: glutathione S-transferase [Pseudomonadales bacterium]|nr:glutathione S-transferase [Pseudomonadales bacterium]